MAPAVAILTTPPTVAREVAPDESSVDTEVSPVTSNVVSSVTASSTFNVPLTVVITPVEAILTTPLPVAREVAPVESNVDTEVSPVTSNVVAREVAPVTVIAPVKARVVPLKVRLASPFTSVELFDVTILLLSPFCIVTALPQDNSPLPSVFNTCLTVPSSLGKVQIKASSITSLGALNPTYLESP